MRSDSSGPFTTLLMMVPLVVVPLLAVFGIPEFAPISASPSGEEKEFDIDFELEPAASAGQPSSPGGDVFAPYSSAGANAHNAAGASPGGEGLFALRDEDSGWSDPFQQPASEGRAEANQQGRSVAVPQDRWNPPETALQGWELDSARAADSESRDAAPAVRGNFDEQSPARATAPAGGVAPSRQIASLEATEFDGSIRNLTQAQATQAAPEWDQPPSSLATTGARKETLTWRSAVRRLNELGIGDFQLERGDRDLFLFSCYFTPSDRPRVTHRFEAEAAEPLDAVQDVLQQVEEWLQVRVAGSERRGIED